MEDNQEKQKVLGFVPVVKPKSARTVPIIAGIFVVLLLVAAVALVVIFLNANQPRIDLLYSPESAVVTLDGKVVTSGQIEVPAGKHEIKAEKYGFETEEFTVEAESGKTIPVHFALTPNTTEAESWYDTHENDARAIEGITGYQYESDNRDMTALYPVLGKLPVKTDVFGIYQQSCEELTPCILIEADEPFFNDAIEYFRSMLDSDVGKYRFMFSDYYNPFKGEG